jgi:hypothetical protein
MGFPLGVPSDTSLAPAEGQHGQYQAKIDTPPPEKVALVLRRRAK